jgi:hypothetical protein
MLSETQKLIKFSIASEDPNIKGLKYYHFLCFLPCVCSGNGKGSLEQHLLAANPQIYC